MKLPWKTILKVGGAVALGVSSVWSAFDADVKTQEAVKKIAAKVVTEKTKKS